MQVSAWQSMRPQQGLCEAEPPAVCWLGLLFVLPWPLLLPCADTVALGTDRLPGCLRHFSQVSLKLAYLLYFLFVCLFVVISQCHLKCLLLKCEK